MVSNQFWPMQLCNYADAYSKFAEILSKSARTSSYIWIISWPLWNEFGARNLLTGNDVLRLNSNYKILNKQTNLWSNIYYSYSQCIFCRDGIFHFSRDPIHIFSNLSIDNYHSLVDLHTTKCLNNNMNIKHTFSFTFREYV